MLQQYDYHVWANRRVCEHLQELTEVVYRQEMVSVFPSIYDAMVHIYVIDSGWLSFFASGGITEMTAEYVEGLKSSIDVLVAETEGKGIEELGGLMNDLAVRFRKFIAEHEDLGAIYPSGEFQASCQDYIQHVVNHGTYHRGNITAMLRQNSLPGIPTDYGYYLYTLSQAVSS